MNRHQIPEHLQRENEIQPSVVTFFEQLRVRVVITSEPRRKLGTKGVLDLYLILPGRRGVGWFDTKQPGETLTVEQVQFVEWNERAGIPCGWGGKPEARAFAERIGLIARVGAPIHARVHSDG